MENYIKNFKSFNKIFIYDFKLGNGGIGDYLKFFMIILMDCIRTNTKLYHKINNLEIEKYVKFKYDFFNITSEEISKLENYIIITPYHYYHKDTYNGNIHFNEVFYFDNTIKENVKQIVSFLPTQYISIHLRMGDKFLETDKKYVCCKKDERKYTEENIYTLIEQNKDKHIFFFCDNHNYKLNLKHKYEQIIITNAKIGHTSLSNTTDKQILDSVTEFYILSNSQTIYAASYSGFSFTASKFNNIEYISL